MRRSITAVVLGLCVVLGWAAPSRAERLADVFDAGNAAGYRGDWEEAARQYQTLLDAGIDDPDVHFNLGVAYAHAGRLGHAILAFERSLALRSGDPAAAEALAAARSVLGHRRAEREGEATVETRPPLIQALLRPASEALLAWLLLGFDALWFGLLCVRRFARGETLRVALAIAWPLAALGCVLAAGTVLVKSEALAEGEAAIVLQEDARLLEGPTRHANDRGSAPEGARVRILEREGRFARVRIPGGASGWLHQDDVEAIRLRH